MRYELWGIVLLSALCARTVNETQIKQAIKRLAFRNKLLVEGAGALSLAAAINTRKNMKMLYVYLAEEA